MLLSVLERQALHHPARTALRGDRQVVRYIDLVDHVRRIASGVRGHVVGLLLENGPAWMLADLSVLAAERTCVPLPPFFSDAQLRHVVDDARIDCLLTDQPERAERIFDAQEHDTLRIGSTRVHRLCRPAAPSPALGGIAKVTYTSGTTGAPKGVCLDRESLRCVVDSLRRATGPRPGDRFLSLLPLAMLLENQAVYVALASGATACLPALGPNGLAMDGIDPERLGHCVERHQPQFLVLVPQLLRVLVALAQDGWRPPVTLRFVAVGGATVSPELLARAAALGLPVYEGYGVSEAASVVALNRPGACRPGSVGRPLPHARVRIADDGEVLLSGALFRGYLGERGAPPSDWPTGDLGWLDEAGYLHLQGRKRDVFITSFGRNVSPEWIERELLVSPAVAQACVVGEDRPFVSALLHASAGASAEAIDAAVRSANARLPYYAAVQRYALLDKPLSVAAGECTANGRLRRSVIAQTRRHDIESLYTECHDAVL